MAEWIQILAEWLQIFYQSFIMLHW